MISRVARGAILGLALFGCCGCLQPAVTISTRDFDQPLAVSSDGAHVWITDASNDSVAELNQSTGALVRIIRLGAPTPYPPSAISSNGNWVWISYHNGTSVTELNAKTGAIVRTIPASPHPGAVIDLSVVGDRLWVPNLAPSSVTEFDASTGKIIRVESARYLKIGLLTLYVAGDDAHIWVMGPPLTELNALTGARVRAIGGSGDASLFQVSKTEGGPHAIADDGVHVWVTNQFKDSVVEIDARTGRVVRVIEGPKGHPTTYFDSPVGIASDRSHVWVTSIGNNSVAELNAKTGALIKVLRTQSFDFRFPIGVSTDGMHVWIANNTGDSVTELNARTGALIRVIR
jgi:DNA-binding beta-propeller fold protein YncE